jgi:hypothetical protein
MTCACHGLPAAWMPDSRYRAGGWWRCRVKHRDRERTRYDRDPVHRIEKLMTKNTKDRRDRLERRIQLSKQEAESHRQVSLEG